MAAERLSDELQALLERQPAGAAPVASAWMLRRFADTIITSFRAHDRNFAREVVEAIAWDLDKLADLVGEPEVPATEPNPYLEWRS